MKQHAENLAKRLDTEFQEIETLHQDKLPMLLKKVEVANILVQELQLHVTKYKLIQTEKDQIIYLSFSYFIYFSIFLFFYEIRD